MKTGKFEVCHYPLIERGEVYHAIDLSLTSLTHRLSVRRLGSGKYRRTEILLNWAIQEGYHLQSWLVRQSLALHDLDERLARTLDLYLELYLKQERATGQDVQSFERVQHILMQELQGANVGRKDAS